MGCPPDFSARMLESKPRAHAVIVPNTSGSQSWAATMKGGFHGRCRFQGAPHRYRHADRKKIEEVFASFISSSAREAFDLGECEISARVLILTFARAQGSGWGVPAKHYASMARSRMPPMSLFGALYGRCTSLSETRLILPSGNRRANLYCQGLLNRKGDCRNRSRDPLSSRKRIGKYLKTARKRQ